MTMRTSIIAAFGALALMAGTALAAEPAPNTAMGVGEGGGVYYNPYVAKQQAPRPIGNQQSEVGVTEQGGGVYHTPATAQHPR
jgi:hypothetical protein